MNDDASVWRKERDFKKRNQHYVPQFWQREFKDANGNLYVRYSLSADPRNERDPDRGKAFDETTKNIFTDDYTYTVSNDLFQPHDVLENLLSAEEGQMKQSHDEVLNATTSITPELRMAFCRSIAVAACRLPHVMSRFQRRRQDMVFAFAEITQLDRPAFDAKMKGFGVTLTNEEYELLRARPEDDLIGTALGFGDLSPQDPNFPMQDALAGVATFTRIFNLMDITILESSGSPFFIMGDSPVPDYELAEGFSIPLTKSATAQFGSLASGGQGFSRRSATPTEIAAINQEQYNNSATHVIGPDPSYLDSLTS
jgi:hypothetical protein